MRGTSARRAYKPAGFANSNGAMYHNFFTHEERGRSHLNSFGLSEQTIYIASMHLSNHVSLAMDFWFQS